MKKIKENPVHETQTVEPSGPALVTPIVETEVVGRPTRRRFPPEYKQRVLNEAAACERGDLGALLRREGLYSSHLTLWRREQRQGLTPKRRGRKPTPGREQAVRLEKLIRENAKLTKSLKHAELIIEAQKKMSELLGILTHEDPT